MRLSISNFESMIINKMKTIQFVCRLIVGILLFFVMDRGIGFVMSHYLFLNHDRTLQHAAKGGDGEDIVIFGASRAAHHYNTTIIEDSLGKSVYNYGIDGKNIFVYYGLLDLVLENTTQKPKLVLLDLSGLDIVKTNSRNKDVISYFYPLFNYNDTINSIIELCGWQKVMSLHLSEIYRNNGTFLPAIKNAIIKYDDKYSGYEPISGIWKTPIQKIKSGYGNVMDEDKLLYLNRMIELTVKFGIPMIIYNSPRYWMLEDKKKEIWFDVVSNLSHQYGIPFYNFEDIYTEHPELFKDPSHLNEEGSIKYTTMILGTMREALNKERTVTKH